MYGYYPLPAVSWVVPVVPIMGGEAPQAPAAPRVFTRAVAEGKARTCVVPDREFTYRRRQRLEILRRRRVPEGLFYLVMDPRTGCAGWVPAEHLIQPRGSDENEDFAVEFADADRVDESSGSMM